MLPPEDVAIVGWPARERAMVPLDAHSVPVESEARFIVHRPITDGPMGDDARRTKPR